jgi:hypothetical protein
MPAPTLAQAIKPTPPHGAGGFDARQVHIRETRETASLRERFAAAALTGLLSRAGAEPDAAMVARAWQIAASMIDAQPVPHFAPRTPRP